MLFRSGYPPPGYPPPAVMVPAAPARPQPPPVIYDWDPDVPPPAGYKVVDRPNGRMIGTGIALFVTGYLMSALVAAVASSAESDEIDPLEDGVTADDWAPLYIPVAGPFIALETLDPNPAGVGMLVLDGILQVGGVAGIVLGVVDRRHKAVWTHQVGRFEIQPEAGLQFRGIRARAHF